MSYDYSYAKNFSLKSGTTTCDNPHALGCSLYENMNTATGGDTEALAWRYSVADNGNWFTPPYAADWWNTANTNLDNVIIASNVNVSSPGEYYDSNAMADATVLDGQFWTWQTPYPIGQYCQAAMKEFKGVSMMSFGIGEDTQDTVSMPHYVALQTCFKAL